MGYDMRVFGVTILGVESRYIGQVQGSIFVDSDVPVARVRVICDVDDPEPMFFFHPDAYPVLAFHGMIAEILDRVEPRGAGEYVIPRSVIEREVAEDVERQLDYLSSYEDTAPMSSYEDNGQCTLPTCFQDGTDSKRGFLLCGEHAAALQGWDDLVDA